MGIKMDGKVLADKICVGLKDRCDALKQKHVYPKLIIITSGNDAASKIYVNNKVKRCKEIGIEPIIKHYDWLDVESFRTLVMDYRIPIIVQEPIIGDVNHEIVSKTLLSVFDVDGFGLFNIGMLATGCDTYNAPCTPTGVMRLLNEYNIPLIGKSALVIGRSNIVGRPMAMMLEHTGCTVTVAHRQTPKTTLRRLILDSDIIVSATGKSNLAEMDMYTGAPIFRDKVIVDVGMNRDENGELCGDFSEKFKQGFEFYTPTPGGTGPMTVVMLMENVIKSYERIWRG